MTRSRRACSTRQQVCSGARMRCVILRASFLQSATTAKEQGSDEKNDEQDEKHLGYSGSNSSDAKKTEEAGDQCDNQKNDGVVKHGPDLALHGLNPDGQMAEFCFPGDDSHRACALCDLETEPALKSRKVHGDGCVRVTRQGQGADDAPAPRQVDVIDRSRGLASNSMSARGSPGADMQKRPAHADRSKMVARPGIEPGTHGFSIHCSTN